MRLISFPLQKRQVLTISRPIEKTSIIHMMATRQLGTGVPEKKWTTAAITPAAAGMGMPTKYFRPGRPGFLGNRLTPMLKRARRPGAAEQKEKADECAPLHHVLPQHGIHGRGQRLEAPGEGQQAGSDAKGNYVRQRIELLAELAGGFGHARDAAIDGVKGDGKADGQGGIVEMPRLLHRSLQALGYGKVAGGDIA